MRGSNKFPSGTSKSCISCIISEALHFHGGSKPRLLRLFFFHFNLRFQPTRSLSLWPRQELPSHVSSSRSSTAPDSGDGNRGRCVSARLRSSLRLLFRSGSGVVSTAAATTLLSGRKTFKLSPSPPPGAVFGLLITLTPRLNVPRSADDLG